MQLSLDIIKELKTTDSIKRKDEIVEAIEKRTGEILKSATKIFRHGTNWWWAWEYYEDSDNDAPDLDVDSNIGGNNLSFCIVDAGNMVFIDKTGEERDISDGIIPFRWLWEDYQQEIIDGIKKFKDKDTITKQTNKQRREELKQLKQKYAASAKLKLTPEELWATGLSTRMPKSLKHLKGEE